MSDPQSSTTLPDATALAGAVRAALLPLSGVNGPAQASQAAFLLSLSHQRRDGALQSEALPWLDAHLPADAGLTGIPAVAAWAECLLTAARLTGDDQRRAAAAAALLRLERLLAEAGGAVGGAATGRAAAALIQGAWTLERPPLLEAARRALGFGEGRLRRADGLMGRLDEAGAPLPAERLDDQVEVGSALLDYAEAAGHSAYLHQSRALAEAALAAFAGPDGALRFQRNQAAAPESEEPEAAESRARAAVWLARLSLALGEAGLLERGRAALRGPALAALAAPARLEAAAVALALLRVAEEPAHIVIPGAPDDPRTQALLAAALRVDHWNRLVQALDPDGDAGLLEALGYYPGAQPAAYVCFNLTCSPPLADPARIGEAMARLRGAGELALLGGPPAGPAPLLGGGVGFLSLRPAPADGDGEDSGA